MNTTIVPYAILFLVSASTVRAYSNGQYHRFFGAVGLQIDVILAQNCSGQLAAMHADPAKGGVATLGCILEHLSETAKTEMAVSSVVLGLLPSALQMIGPKVNDVAVLALHRPLLALLMILGSPCATLMPDWKELEPDLQLDPLWPHFMKKKKTWVNILISGIEFGLVGVAAFNSVYFGYHLSFETVALITTYLGTYGNTLEAFSPMLWVFCSIPIHILGFLIARSYRMPSSSTLRATPDVSLCLRLTKYLKTWIVREVTPCAYGEHVPLTDKAKPSYWLLGLQWAIKISVWAQVIYGVFVLSSTLFISLWASLEIVGKFLGASLACRLVLAFELYGSQQISRQGVSSL